ncbi:MAG: hypothetical protein LBI78_00435 [Campylobacteraceae bacterium]|nr:hypothetical protein [Campylobacteraceae bacterium]
MKKSIIVMCVSLICIKGALCDSADIVEYDRFFNEIGEVRVGITNQDIDSITNPFVIVATPVDSNNINASSPTFKLSAIFENKVKINDSWLTQGSIINGLRVVAIKQNSVVLGSENRAIELFLREKNENSVITIN